MTPLDSENSPTDQTDAASGPSSEAENENCDGTNNGDSGVSSTSEKEMLQPEQTEVATLENNAIPQQEEEKGSMIKEDGIKCSYLNELNNKTEEDGKKCN